LAKKAKKEDELQFEEALEELEAIVDDMEQGELSLEDSLKAFERGITLTRQCQAALKNAEQKVNLLLEKQNQDVVEPFKPNSDE